MRTKACLVLPHLRTGQCQRTRRIYLPVGKARSQNHAQAAKQQSAGTWRLAPLQLHRTSPLSDDAKHLPTYAARLRSIAAELRWTDGAALDFVIFFFGGWGGVSPGHRGLKHNLGLCMACNANAPFLSPLLDDAGWFQHWMKRARGNGSRPPVGPGGSRWRICNVTSAKLFPGGPLHRDRDSALWYGAL